MNDKEPPLFDPYTYEGSPAVAVSQGYMMIGLSTVLFGCLNYYLIKRGPPAEMTGDVFRWRNTFVSFVHSIIAGTGVLYCLMFTKMFDDLVLYCDHFSYLLCALSTGYFIYDFLDYMLNKKLVSDYEITLHHICSIWCFGYTVVFRFKTGYAIVGLMTEVNSIFLHARKVMQLNHWPSEHWPYRSVISLSFATFLSFCFYGVLACMVGLVTHRKRATVTFLSVMWVIIALMLIINPNLLWRLIKDDILRPQKKLKVELNGNNNTLADQQTKKSL